MKKIFYFLLLMISGIVWGQISQFNNLCTNNSNLQLSNTYYEYNFKTAEITTDGKSCSKDQIHSYKGINYYKIVTGGSFEFKLASDKLVNFHVWVLSESELNNFFLNKETRYNAVRSSYSSNNTEKGLNDFAMDECEFYGTADGKLKVLNVNAGEYIAIGVLGSDISTKYSITPGGTATVCEPEPNPGNTQLSNKCYDDVYSISEVKTKVKSQILTDYGQTINVSNIKIFSSNTSTNEIITDINSTSGLIQNYVAKVYNGSRVEYIYDVNIRFRQELTFDVRNVQEFLCANSIFLTKNQLISKVSPNLSSNNYADYEVYVDGVVVNGNVSLNNSNSYRVKLKYIGTEFCPVREFSDEVEFELINSNPILPSGRFKEVCNDETLSEADILAALVVDTTIYEIVSMPVVPYNFTGNEAEFDVQIRDRTDNTCTSNIVKFKVIKKANVSLNTLPNFVDCRNEFTLSNLQAKIAEVRNSDTSIDLIINYNSISYTETQLQSLYDLILRTTTQTDFNLSITGSKTGFCESTVPLKITLNNSSVPRVSFDVLLSPSCLGVTEDYTFSVDEIKENIKGDLGFTNIADFEILNSDGTPFQPVNVLANSNVTLTFKIRKKSESCLSEEMYLIVETVNQPNVVSATYSDKFCEGEILTINDGLLEHYFGVNVLDYIIFIDGIEYIQENPIQKILNFRGNTSLNISIEFQNFLRRTCSTTVNLTINKKPTLDVIPPALNNYITNAKVVYCEEDDTNAKNQIQTILDYIQNNYSLTSSKTKDQIFAEFNSAQGSVDVDFYNSDYCGKITLKLNYQKNVLPNIDVKNPEPLCTGEKYKLDFTTQTGYENYNYYVEKEDGTSVLGTYTFDLDAGNYKITIEYNNSTTQVCSVVKTLEIKNAIPPEISKITINEKSVIVSAKGNGKLEYALFDSDGKLIVDWQTKNELIIPDDIKNNDFTVKVRLNNCGVSERKNVIYLALPNVVTPNNDGKNDVWQPMTKDGKVNDTSNSYKLIIFDRYGKHILSQEGTDIIKWDGTLNGKPVADGTYWYLLEFSKQSDDLQVLYSGSILVKRKIN